MGGVQPGTNRLEPLGGPRRRQSIAMQAPAVGREMPIRVELSLRYPVEDIQPPIPNLALPDEELFSWNRRVEEALADVVRRRRPEGAQAAECPPLGWYGSELLNICGQALVAVPSQIMRLRALQQEKPALLSTRGSLWPLLLEVATLLAAAAYHCHRGAQRLAEEAPASLRQLPAVSALYSRAIIKVEHGVSELPDATFPPMDAEMAFADISIDVMRAQAHGAPLGTALRLLGQRAEAEQAAKPDTLAQIFLLVPGLTYALRRLALLMPLAEEMACRESSEPTVSSVEVYEQVAQPHPRLPVRHRSSITTTTNEVGVAESCACGAPILPEWRYCRKCGAPRARAATMSPRPTAVAAEMPALPAGPRPRPGRRLNTGLR